MRSTSVLLPSLLVLWCQSHKAADHSRLAHIGVSVTTTFGEPVGKTLVILRLVAPEVEYRKYGDNVSFKSIPFGLYNLEIQASGFSTRYERLGVYQSEVDLQIGLSPSLTHSAEQSEIEGRLIHQSPAPNSLMARLVPLYSSELIENKVDSSGKFRFAELVPGRYLLLIFDQREIRGTKLLDYFGGRLALTIDLNQ